MMLSILLEYMALNNHKTGINLQSPGIKIMKNFVCDFPYVNFIGFSFQTFYDSTLLGSNYVVSHHLAYVEEG